MRALAQLVSARFKRVRSSLGRARTLGFRSWIAGFALVQALLASPARAADGDNLATPTSDRAPARDLLRNEAKLIAWLGRHSPELAAARARVAQSSADLATTRLFPNPVFDGSLSDVPIGETNPPGLGFGEVAIYTFGLSETFELGKRGPRSEAAGLREQSARLQADAALGERLAAARSAIGLAVHLGSRLVILDESLQAAENGAQLERTRLEQKALSGMDYDRLLLDLASLRSEFARSQADYASALETCRAVLGGECDMSGANDEDLAAAVPVSLPASNDARLLERPDLRALDFDRQAAERDAALARAKALPDLTVRVGYTHDLFLRSGDNANTLAFSVQMPLPIFDRGQHDAEKNLSHAEELSQSKISLLRSSKADLAGLLSRKIVLEKNLEALQHDTLPRSRSVLESAQQAFDIGGTSLTDLLLARRNHIGLELTLLEQDFELFGVRNEIHHLLALDAAAKDN
ncbi:MAG TPA: TolC family protein [Polyangiaceae bacterium]|nr:TolC family protein [Polyangiaceae bacterium]